jgi:biopolymer transport protein ExbB
VFSIIHILTEGGILMVPLGFLSVIALAVVLERTIFFARLPWARVPFETKLKEMVRYEKIREAMLWLSTLQGAPAATALAALGQWGKGAEAIENAMVTISHHESEKLNRYLSVLETTVTASPLIGLLGTITGMMGVFRAVSEKISHNPQADTSGILAGIGEALIATASGILLAVICLFFHNIFQGLAERQMDLTQSAINMMVALNEEETRIV